LNQSVKFTTQSKSFVFMSHKLSINLVILRAALIEKLNSKIDYHKIDNSKLQEEMKLLGRYVIEKI